MDVAAFVEGPFLRFVFLLFALGILIRMVLFLYATIQGARDKEYKYLYTPIMLVRSLLPFHRAIKKRPAYSVLRYLFHACLIIVPIWYSSHIVMWEDSRLAWSWNALPDGLADGMTLILLILSAVFLLRRVFVPGARRVSGLSDYLIILCTVFPFLTGIMLAHGNFSSGSFLGENLFTIHVLTGEAMLLMVIFLFCRTRIYHQRCTGCAACEISCTAGALETSEKGSQRSFGYHPYQCISCGECVLTCPEDAVELRHQINLKGLFQNQLEDHIRVVEMKLCEKCGALIAPIPQLEKITSVIDNPICLCTKCKMDEYANTFYEKKA
jgi:NAD-dependent dihydropyrimidine dehydrogenase PreA subunit/nitrate reductase gamma subunit